MTRLSEFSIEDFAIKLFESLSNDYIHARRAYWIRQLFPKWKWFSKSLG